MITNGKHIKFKVFSRLLSESESAVDANAQMSHIWISIFNVTDDKPDVHQNKFCRDVLFLEFDDTDTEGCVFGGREMELMSKDQAHQLIEFVKKHLDRIGLICVNCEAGISRSSACAAALSLLINGHDSGIGDDNYYYYPNAHVQSLILREGTALHELAIKDGFKKDI